MFVNVSCKSDLQFTFRFTGANEFFLPIDNKIGSPKLMTSYSNNTKMC